MLKLKQIEGVFSGYIKVAGFSTTGSTATVTSQITSALTTAGKGGTSVPLQVSANASAVGVVVAANFNRVKVLNPSTEQEFRDGSNNEVYGKLTEAAGVYTLSFFSNADGTETAYTFPSSTSIDFYFRYRFDLPRLPDDFAIALSGSFDASGVNAVNTETVFIEPLTVSATNTVSALTKTPVSAAKVNLFINGEGVHSFGGASAPFSVSGKNITFSQTNLGYPVETTDRVIAAYSTTE